MQSVYSRSLPVAQNLPSKAVGRRMREVVVYRMLGLLVGIRSFGMIESSFLLVFGEILPSKILARIFFKFLKSIHPVRNKCIF